MTERRITLALLARIELGVTNHAREQAGARLGLSRGEIIHRVRAALRAGRGAVREGARIEAFIPLEGPDGQLGTAVGVLDNRRLTIVTVRDARAATQAERANEPLTWRPFAALREK